MKRIYVLLIAFFFLGSCSEHMPMIGCLTCGNDPKDPEPEDRNVIIEEFTGVRCVQCPAGSAEIQRLKSIHGERLIAVSIHAGSWANPYNQSQYNFKTDEGEQLLGFLGIPDGFPTGVIDRKLFPGQPDLQLETAGIWSGIIGEELERDANIKLEIENDWNESDRTLKVNVLGTALENIIEEVKLTILITEDGIIDTQIVPNDGIIDDYEHNHVLRKTLTAFDGDKIAESFDLGATFSEEYSFSLPNEWNAENCNVVAFVHVSQSSKQVLQAIEKHLTD